MHAGAGTGSGSRGLGGSLLCFCREHLSLRSAPLRFCSANLGLRIVAEGVEDQATLDSVRDLGCHVAQGYHISWPLSDADFRTWLLTESAQTPPRLRMLSGS